MIKVQKIKQFKDGVDEFSSLKVSSFTVDIIDPLDGEVVHQDANVIIVSDGQTKTLYVKQMHVR